MSRFGYVIDLAARHDGRRRRRHADANQADLERLGQRADRLLHDRSRRPLDVTDLVAVDAARAARRPSWPSAAIGRGVPLLKRVLGFRADRLPLGDAITVDGVEMGDALERDRIGPRSAGLAGLPPHPRPAKSSS
jgi:hypothetical protein